jgi:hypothetical protein
MLVDEVRPKFELRGLGYRANSAGGIIALAAGFGRTCNVRKSTTWNCNAADFRDNPFCKGQRRLFLSGVFCRTHV